MNMEKIPILKAGLRAILGRTRSESLFAWAQRAISGQVDGYWCHRHVTSYYYGVWLKHLVLLRAHGMASVPQSVAEFGPGDSLGVGLSALLSGANRYCGFDAENFTRPDRDQVVLGELVGMLASRYPRPKKGFPDFDQYLGPDLFPHDILDDTRLRETLSPDRIERLRGSLALAASSREDTPKAIQLVAPWQHRVASFTPDFDLLLSHTVLEFLPNLKDFFKTCADLLRPGGWMSHQVDFRSVGITNCWNGHLAYSEDLWRFMVAHRAYSPNRRLLSEYLRDLELGGFELVTAMRRVNNNGLRRRQMAKVFQSASDEDLTCSGAFIIARKL